MPTSGRLASGHRGGPCRRWAHRPSALALRAYVARIAASGPRSGGALCDSQVTALAQETTEETTHTPDADQTAGPDSLARSPACYLWATLIARLFEIVPLTCPHCGAEMKSIAFVTETPSVRAILAHIGEPTRAPVIAPARAPPREDASVELEPDDDPLAQPELDYEFDQRSGD